MAVENKWAIDDQETDYPQTSFKKQGQDAALIASKVAVAAADDDGSKYGLAVLAPDMLVKDIKVANQAITGGTDYDLGLYRVAANGEVGAVIDADIFADGVDMSSARARGSEVSGMSALGVDDSDKTVRELVEGVTGSTDNDPQYALVLTANTVGTAAGNLIAFVDVTNP